MKETAVTLLSTERIANITALTYSHVSPKVPEIMEKTEHRIRVASKTPPTV